MTYYGTLTCLYTERLERQHDSDSSALVHGKECYDFIRFGSCSGEAIFVQDCEHWPIKYYHAWIRNSHHCSIFPREGMYTRPSYADLGPSLWWDCAVWTTLRTLNRTTIKSKLAWSRFILFVDSARSANCCHNGLWFACIWDWYPIVQRLVHD